MDKLRVIGHYILWHYVYVWIQMWNSPQEYLERLVTSSGHRIATGSSSKELWRQDFCILYFFVYSFGEEGIRRLTEWWTWMKGPWHGRGAERHNLLQLCGQRPWISLLPDWQVRSGLNGVRVKTKITFFAFRKYLFYFLPGILLANNVSWRKFLSSGNNCGNILTVKKLYTLNFWSKCNEGF